VLAKLFFLDDDDKVLIGLAPRPAHDARVRLAAGDRPAC
jgi:hypothetical protein